MDNSEKGFQALELTLTNPETGKEHNLFFATRSNISPEEFNQIIQSEKATVGECLQINKLSQPFDFQDIAAYPQFKEFIEAVAEGMEKSAG